MNTTYGFSLKKRLVGALPPLAIAAVLAVLVAAFTRAGSWQFWVGLGFVAVVLMRAAGYLWWGQREVRIDARGLTRSGRTVDYSGAELELRTVERDGKLAVHEVVLWMPRNERGERNGVGFDESLEHFEQAVRALVLRMAEMRIVVSTPTEPNVRDARREQVLEPLRPSPAERALLELGKTALSVPPHLRN